MLKGRYVAMLEVDFHMEGSVEPARTRLHDGTMDKAVAAWVARHFGDSATVRLTRQMADLYEVGDDNEKI